MATSCKAHFPAASCQAHHSPRLAPCPSRMPRLLLHKPLPQCASFSSQQQPTERHQDLSQDAAQEPISSRRGILAAAAVLCSLAPSTALAEVLELSDGELASTPGVDTTITNVVYFDIGIAPRSFKTAEERTLGDRSVIPLSLAEPVGRITLGLYGKSAPGTVANFLRLVRSGALQDTVFSRVLPGEYIQAGGQGFFRMGQVEAGRAELQPNPDLLSSAGFSLRHLRPGTLSLSLAENDEDPQLKMEAGYRNTEFLITTGPGPVPRLDSENLVFGRVLDGMSVVATIAQVPTFKPSERSAQLNMFAQAIGDDRAAQVRRKYGKPLKAVIITGVGELPLSDLVPPEAAAAAAVAAAPLAGA